MLKTERIGSAHFEFHPDGVLVCIGDAGCMLTEDVIRRAIHSATIHYGNRFVYVSNRINDYSADFKAYRRIDESPEIQAMAVVAHRSSTHRISGSERLMLPETPYAVFDDLDSAIAWGRGQLDGD